MKIWVGPTGRLIKGHVLDSAMKPLERALRTYDPLLYIAWNPRKLEGWGCWEVRRRPEKNTVKDIVVFEGNTYVIVDSIENNFVHHVKDWAFLNYSLLKWVQDHDMWAKLGGRAENFGKELEYQEAKSGEAADKRKADELTYNAKQFKREIADFKDFILSGNNPARIADHWNK